MLARRMRGLLHRASPLALFVLALACSSGVPTSPPRAFNRPTRMAFVCFDVSNADIARVVPLEECRPTVVAVDGTGRQTFPTGRALHALVTQTTRGEVAAVNLTTRVILDSNRRIPGATFVPVGELPTDIVVPELAPSCAWVSSAGEHTISAIPSVRFRPEHDPAVPDFVTQVRLPGRPQELVLSADERTLWVSLPDLGAVARIAIDPERCVAGAPDLLPLSETIPPGVPPQGGDDTCSGTDACRICPTTLPVAPSATITPRDYVPDDPRSRPTAMELDNLAGVLLVADANLPLIHRIDTALATERAPLSLGAPIRDFAITPPVPTSYAVAPAPITTTRYLYAIDDTDGTVMAVDYGDEADAGFGAVLSIDGEQSLRPDRMPMNVAARAIEIVTPGYDPLAADPRIATGDAVFLGLCDFTADRATAPGPGTLRGVFVNMAMTDGTVRMADVYDLDAPCRGRTYGMGTDPTTPDCIDPTVGADLNVYIRRHRIRAGVFLTRLASVVEGPLFVVNGANLRLDRDGSAGPTPSLAPVTCPAGMGTIFPNDATADEASRICSQLDPFAAAVETWIVGWQGALPLTSSTSGNFRDEGGMAVLEGRTDFCAHGVLSARAAALVPAGEPEFGYSGDLLAITTLPAATLLDTDATCRTVVGITTAGQTPQPILVPIEQAFSRPADLREPYVGRLLLLPDAPILDAATGLPRGVTLADARRCLGDELVAYDVRSHGAYTVAGSRTGFLHRVIAGSDAECVVDALLPRTSVGRAFHEIPFENPRLVFTMSQAMGTPPGAGAELRFRIGIIDQRFVNIADAQLLRDLGATSSLGRLLTLPTEITWNQRTQHAYVIEAERRGLVEMEMVPYQSISGTRFE